MPGYRRHFQENDVAFVTLVTAGRSRWLASERARRHVLQCLRTVKACRPFRHFGHVLLDDHIHWMLSASGSESVSGIVRNLKMKVWHERQAMGWSPKRLWQSRFYDHIIRDERDFKQHLDYIHYNPVRHGYVAIAHQWRWSSFHSYVARGMYPHCWGTREPDGPTEAGEP